MKIPNELLEIGNNCLYDLKLNEHSENDKFIVYTSSSLDIDELYELKDEIDCIDKIHVSGQFKKSKYNCKTVIYGDFR